MKLEKNEEIIDFVKEADLVLIGIGEEWGVSFEEMVKSSFFAEKFQKMKSQEERDGLVPYLQREYLKECRNEKLERAYKNLLSLLEDKDYFLISMNKDRFPVEMGFKEDRCVFPCGNYKYLQCDKGCSDNLLEASDIAEHIYEQICQSKDFEKIEMPRCRSCGAALVFNSIEAEKYVEEGYLEAWDTYMKWLQKTVNRKLCILELGVDLRFPSVIRWPFEKTTFYNQKAQMFRIHRSLSQSAEKIQDRCHSREEDSVTYMANLFVS